MKISRETSAIATILRYFSTNHWEWVVSTVLKVEINRNPNLTQRQDINRLIDLAHYFIRADSTIRARSKELELLGFKTYDALHIACAESAESDVLLTTDERMLRNAKRVASKLRVRVEIRILGYKRFKYERARHVK